MSLYDDLIEAMPELTDADFNGIQPKILLRNDSDGVGDYIEKWEHEKPIPEGFKLGK